MEAALNAVVRSQNLRNLYRARPMFVFVLFTKTYTFVSASNLSLL